MINGYTELNLTKLDVLDGFEEIKVAVGYKLDGVEVSGFPGESILSPFRSKLMNSRLGPTCPGRSPIQDSTRMENRHLQDQGFQRTTRKLPSLHQVYRGLPQGSYSVHWSRTREGGDDKAVLELNASCDGLLFGAQH